MKNIRIFLLLLMTLLSSFSCEKLQQQFSGKKKLTEKNLDWVQFNCKKYCTKANEICKDHIAKKWPLWKVETCSNNCFQEFKISSKRIATQISQAAQTALVCERFLLVDNYGAFFSHSYKKEKDFQWAKEQCGNFCNKLPTMCSEKLKKNKTKIDPPQCISKCLKKYKKAPSAISHRLLCVSKQAKNCKEVAQCNRCGETKCLSKKEVNLRVEKFLKKKYETLIQKRKAFLDKMKKEKQDNSSPNSSPQKNVLPPTQKEK